MDGVTGSGFERGDRTETSAADRPSIDVTAAWIGMPGLVYHALNASLRAHQICIDLQANDLICLSDQSEFLSKCSFLLIDFSEFDQSEDSLRSIEALSASHPQLKFVFFVGHRSSIENFPLRDQADLVIKHSASIKQVIDALNLVLHGVAFLPMRRPSAGSLRPRVDAEAPRSEAAEAAETSDAPRALSGREVRILQSLHAGHSNKVIAGSLSIAESTVKVHVKSILRKIKADNRTQAAVWASANLQSLSNGRC